jgi:urea transport system permease protein
MKPLALLLFLVLCTAGLSAWGDEGWQKDLASGDYARMEEAVRQLGGENDKEAERVLQALSAGRLYAAGGALYVEDGQGKLMPLSAGAPPAPPSAKKLRMNNTLRRAVETALSALRLLDAPDPEVRRRAAEEAFHSRDVSLRPTIEKALARENDPRVLTALQEARAVLLLEDAHASPQEVRKAIAILEKRGDEAALAALNAYHPADPDLLAAARRAEAAISRRLAFWSAVAQLYYGLSLGSVLLLAASGLAITFGVMGVINMAHGEIVMLGAYTTSVVQQLIGALAPALMPLSVFFAIPAAFLICGGVGMAIERVMIRRLYGRPLETLLATAGLSLILQEIVRNVFGASNREVITPSWMSGEIHWGGLALTLNRLAIICFSAAVFFALLALLRFTSFGIKMRAVTQNRAMAAAMGIRTPRIDALTFGLGSAIAGLGGVALSQIDNVSPNLGQNYIIDSFLVVVFGGVGNLWGTGLGALVLGFVDKMLEPVAGAVLGKITLLILVVIFIQWRPRGLFPLKGRAVEA